MALQSQDDKGIPTGQLRPATTSGEYNKLLFTIQQTLSKMQTATLVKVMSCTNSGGLSPVGSVDVVPMVGQVDGAGGLTPHTTIFNIPYLRVQGGANAVIIDPEAGDIGICVFASRDISKVKATKKAGAPGSLRQYSFSDGLYLGGYLNGTPTQYVQFSATGITLKSPLKVTVEAPDVEVIAATSATITSPIIKLGASGQALLSFVTSTFISLFNGHTHPVPALGTSGQPTQQAGSSELTSTVTGG